MPRIRPHSLLSIGSLIYACGSSTVAARADITIVSKATTTGSMPGQKQRTGGAANPLAGSGTTTTYIQGHKVRVEAAKSVFLYDGDTKTRYMINPLEKTYRLMPVSLGGLTQLAAMLDIKTSVSVAPTGKSQQIAGRAAREYTYKETVSLSLKPGAFGNGPAPRPKTSASEATAAMPVMVVNVQGHQWVAPVTGLPENIGDLLANSSGMNQIMDTVPGLKALIDELRALKGYPIESHQEITVSGLGMAQASGGKPGAMMTVDVTTLEIRQSTLPKSLFEIPAGYKRLTGSERFPAGSIRKKPEIAP